MQQIVNATDKLFLALKSTIHDVVGAYKGYIKTYYTYRELHKISNLHLTHKM